MKRYNICIETQSKVLTCDYTEQLLSLVKWKQESEHFVKSRKFDAYFIESVRLRETLLKALRIEISRSLLSLIQITTFSVLNQKLTIWLSEN